jgi:hypothetical protein
MSDQTFTTKHLGFATFLRFALGDHAHLSTVMDGGTAYTFEDDPPGRCRELSDQFFAHGSVAVNDARALLECSRAMKQTAAAARNSADGTWARGDAI